MAQWNLLKLKKYKGLVSEDDSMHSIHTVNQISDISKLSGHLSQTENANQTFLSGQDGQHNSSSPQYPNNHYQSSYQHAAPYFGTCYMCGIFGHLGKIVQIGLIICKVHSCFYKAYHHQQVNYYLV